MNESYFLVRRLVRQDERELGTRIVPVSLKNEAADVVLDPHENIRMFTDGLTGCVAMGYIATLGEGRRQAYMHHAFYGTVRDDKARFAPARAGKPITRRSVIMARSFDPLESFTAATPDIPYDAFSTRGHIKPLIDSMVERCGDPNSVMIVPYNEISNRYSLTLVVDVPAFEPGTILADGRVSV